MSRLFHASNTYRSFTGLPLWRGQSCNATLRLRYSLGCLLGVKPLLGNVDSFRKVVLAEIVLD